MKSKELWPRLNVKRFVLAGASDLPIAIEALLQDKEQSMHLALILLGLQPKNISYQAGKAHVALK